MNKRQSKKIKKNKLKTPMLVKKEKGLLGGYSCPNCGNKYVREPYCQKCNQLLIYDESQRDKAPLWKSNDEWENQSL